MFNIIIILFRLINKDGLEKTVIKAMKPLLQKVHFLNLLFLNKLILQIIEFLINTPLTSLPLLLELDILAPHILSPFLHLEV